MDIETFPLADFEQLVHRYERKLTNYALGIVHNSEDAEEVVQDAFLRAYRALNSMPVEKRNNLHLTPWLFVITRNVALNRYQRKRPRVVSLDAMVNLDQADSPCRNDQTPEFYAEQHEHHELVAAAISELPAHFRPAAMMRFLHGLKHTEIARRLRQPLGTVKSHVHRATLIMRQRLQPDLRAA
jgi:RNA polymerase sigma-70 factor (ECF subfamily)